MESQNEISLYRGNLTDECLIRNIVLIKKAFPSLPLQFYDVLTDRIYANKFSDARLEDAICNVIDNCIYPIPTIANFISFDKKIKIYNYKQIVDMVNDGDDRAFERYKKIKMRDLPEAVWIHINDIAKYNIIS